MDRAIGDRNILDDICVKFCNILEKHCKYIIVSGFVAISSGRTRATEDIDIIIEKISKNKFTLLHGDLIKNEFNCMQGDNALKLYHDYLIYNLSIRYTYGDSALPEMELKLAKDELDEHQINNRVKLNITGLDVWFSSINSNIAFKEELLKSDKDMEDAKHLRIVFADSIDEKEINKIKSMIKRLRL
ncbi:hypothetical protein HYU10_00350 [Candidatus Woesearchaeota archaeon]|nr:hypothetical protein [Candidatus Woesearchaeota archaeon]